MNSYLFLRKQQKHFLQQRKMDVGMKNNMQFFKITQKSRKLMGVVLVSHVESQKSLHFSSETTFKDFTLCLYTLSACHLYKYSAAVFELEWPLIALTKRKRRSESYICIIKNNEE